MAEENYTARFRVDISDLKKGITDANKQIQRANAEFRNATAGMDDWRKSTEGLTAKIQQQEKVVEQEKAKLQLLREQQTRLTQAQTEGQQIINTLNQKYQEAVRTYGEASEEAKTYAKQLEQAQAAQERNATAAENLETRILNQDTAVRNAEAQVQNYQNALNQLQQEEQEAANHTETLTETVDRQEQELAELKDQYVNVVTQQGANSDEAQELAGQIENLSGELRDNRTRLQEAEDAADDLDHTLDDTGDSAEDAANRGIQTLSVAVGNFVTDVLETAIAKLGEFISKTMEIGMDYEAQMSKVQAISGTVSDDALPAIIEAAEQMGLSFSEGTTATETAMNILDAKASALGRSTKFSASEVAQGFEYMAMAGWGVEDMLGGIDGILNLAAASGADLATTSDIVTDALTAMGYSAQDATQLADVMASASSNANTNVEMMGETFKYVAPVAGALGFSMEDTALAVGLMANSGIKASQSGTALRSTLSRLTNPTAKMMVAMTNLGLATAETTREIDSDALEKAQEKVAQKTEKLTEAQEDYNEAVAKYSNTDSVELREANIKVSEAIYKVAEANEQYGEGSLEAAKAQVELEKAQESYNETALKYGENSPIIQDALKKVEEAQKDLAEANSDLMIEQEGSIINVEKFANILTDSEGNMRSFRDVMGTLREHFQGLDEDQQTQYASIIFGQEAMSGMLAIINASDEDFAKLSGAIDDSTGSAEDMAAVMQDNLSGDMTTLNSKLEAIQNNFYKKMSPALRAGAELLGKFLDGFSWLSEKLEPFTPLLFALGGAISYVVAMAVKGLVVAKVIPLLTKGFKALWGIMTINPIGLIITAIAGLIAGFIYLWNTSESFRNFWMGIWKGIKEAFATFSESILLGIDVIKDAWEAIKTKVSEVWEGIKTKVSEVWEGIKAIFAGIGEWFNENVVQPIIDFFTPVIEFFVTAWNIISELASGCWEIIKAVWEVVSAWFNEHVIQPVKTFFSDMWNAISTAASNTWNAIKTVWKIVSSWFNQHIIMPVKNFFTGMWEGLKQGASDAWEGVKNVFSPIANWFKEKFSNAWQKVKDVFSTGGKVFDGIKEGITGAFKTVVNAIIRGINKVIAIPFNAINNTLDKIRNVEIMGFSPFENLVSRFNVPQIPELAQGGILSRGGRMIIAGEDGDEAIVPLEKNTGGIKRIAQLLLENMNFPDIASAISDLVMAIRDIKIPDMSYAIDNIGHILRDMADKIGITPQIDVTAPDINYGRIMDIAQLLLENMKFPDIASAISKLTETISDILNDMGVISPRDMTAPDIDYGRIKDIAQSIAAEVTVVVQPAPTPQGDTVVNNNYTFEQTNTSPKALSRWEIYRQTKNLINAAKGV